MALGLWTVHGTHHWPRVAVDGMHTCVCLCVCVVFFAGRGTTAIWTKAATQSSRKEIQLCRNCGRNCTRYTMPTLPCARALWATFCAHNVLQAFFDSACTCIANAVCTGHMVRLFPRRSVQTGRLQHWKAAHADHDGQSAAPYGWRQHPPQQPPLRYHIRARFWHGHVCFFFAIIDDAHAGLDSLTLSVQM